MAVVLYGPAIALASVIRISISTSIIVVGVICTFYTSIVSVLGFYRNVVIKISNF